MTQVILNPTPKWVARGRFLDVATPLPGLTEKALDGVQLLHDGTEGRSLQTTAALVACTDAGPVPSNITACIPPSTTFKAFRLWDVLEASVLNYSVGDLDEIIDGGWEPAMSYAFAQAAASQLSLTAVAPSSVAFGSTSVTCCDAVAALEGALAAALKGRQGTIHMGPGSFFCVADDLTFVDGAYFTPFGTKVIVDAGYSPMPKPADAGATAAGRLEEYIYGTGEVFFGSTHTRYLETNSAQWTNIAVNTVSRLKETYGVVAYQSVANFAIRATLDSNKAQP